MKQQLQSPVFIGADVLEIMSVAMYAEPLVIFRELLQNAADSIDTTISSGRLAPLDGTVSITLDPSTRTVSVLDNGAGLPNDLFDARMLSFGGSTKRDSIYRGFRGIGRLAGLGQCKTLVFRSRAEGDRFVKEARWSAMRVREMLSSGKQVTLEELALDAVDLQEVRASDEAAHFFEARLEGVRRLADDRLFDAHLIGSYLGQVAPVPFSPDFSMGSEIRNELLRRGPLLELNVSISGKVVLKPYKDKIEVRAGRTARIRNIEFLELPALHDGTAAYGWIGHHDYLGALRRDTPGRGLRVRSGNLQIGDEALLASAFPEERFNSWTVGEFHVFDAHLRPNARRDAFEPSIHVDNLYNQLRPHAASIARRCRQESRDRKQTREIEALAKALDVLESALGRESSPFAVALRKLIATSVQESVEQLKTRVPGRDEQGRLLAIQRRANRLASRFTDAAPSARDRGRLDVLKWLHGNASADVFSAAVRALRRDK